MAAGRRLRRAVVVLALAAAAASGVATSARAPARNEWAAYRHDLANTGTNLREKRIDRRSVRRLVESWSMHGLVGVSGTPAVSRGVAYFGDWTGSARAVDAASGRELWHTAVGGVVVGAPAVHGDAVYVSSGATLYRLDRATGAERWHVVTNEHPLAQINASPVVVDGLVLQGVASFEVTIPKPEYTFRGSLGAYDAETGAERWRLYTTPNDATAGAGVGVWSTPAVDRARGMLYVGSGNTYAEPSAPLADSILAIDYRSGRLAWSTQFTAPDVFSAGNPRGKDADVGASPNLWRVRGRALVGAGDKAGVFHALDRDTGAIVWETMLTPGSVFGGEIGSAALVDRRLVVVSNVGDPATNFPVNVAKAFALDPRSGAVLWEAEPFPGRIFAPVSAVRGVAFVGTDRGTLAALDTRTGDVLWMHTAPARTGCGPSIAAGRVLWGYGFVLFGPAGDGGIMSLVVGR